MTDKKILILGGGTGGITVAARLCRQSIDPACITIVEPSSKHYYQPLWTLVGGGIVPRSSTERSEKDYIPAGVRWVQAKVLSIDPVGQRVKVSTSEDLAYDFLVIAIGMELWWHKVEGLPETLGKNGVCSNYSYEHVEYTWECIRQFSGGRALFTHPSTPIKCGGAPQKIMYLAEHAFEKRQVRSEASVEFFSAGALIFAVPRYADALTKIIAQRDIKTHFKQNLVAVDGIKRRATFVHMETGEKREESFEMLHVTPPMGAPSLIKEAGLANAGGFVDVDKGTLRHVTYGNIFSLGDCSSLPTSKTGAAIRKQAPVLVANLTSLLENRPLPQVYDGYTSCPIVTGYGRLILAEFDYAGKPVETFPFDQSKERLSMYLLKKYLLPLIYWIGMLRGRA